MNMVMRSSDVELSIIVPMYNEAETAALYFETVVPIIERVVATYEIICINDGSMDKTLSVIRSARMRNANIKLVNLSRNFGKEAAITAGLDLAVGKAVIPMDADLQDPPELIENMVVAWRDGAQVVLARRADRSTDGVLKRLTAKAFYRVFSKLATPAIPTDVGDYRLMDRVVVEALKQLPERSRFMKGLFAWVGYRQVTIDYTRPARSAGSSSFSLPKLWNFALDGIVSFSSLPLKVWSYFGCVVSLVSLLYLAFLVSRTLIFGVEVPGYASTLSVILLFNGIILIR